MASPAWTLKAWAALRLPETGRWKEKRRAEKRKLLRMEFRTFVNTIQTRAVSDREDGPPHRRPRTERERIAGDA